MRCMSGRMQGLADSGRLAEEAAVGCRSQDLGHSPGWHSRAWACVDHDLDVRVCSFTVHAHIQACTAIGAHYSCT